MPFTLAHAAVAPPLVRLGRNRLVVSALVMGSVAPDFQSIATLNSERAFSHSRPGLFVFCLPAALLALVVWHRVLKRPLAAMLPARLGPVAAMTAAPFRFAPLSRFAAVCLSALVGSVSHVVWDDFTHSDGFFVRRIDFLAEPIHWHGLAVYDALQYVTGLVAVVYLAWWCNRWLEHHEKTPRPAVATVPVASPRLRWTVLSAVTVVGVTVGAANAARAVGFGPDVVVGHAVLGMMAGCAVAATAAGALLSRSRF